MKLGVGAKLFFVSLALFAVTAIAGYSYARRVVSVELKNQAARELSAKSQLIALSLSKTTDEERWKNQVSELAARSNTAIALFTERGRRIASSENYPRGALPAGWLGQRHLIQRHGEKRLVLKTAVRLDDVDRALTRLGTILAVATLVALLVAMLMSTLAARMATRNALSLVRTARELASGDLSARSEVGGGDDFGELGDALNRLGVHMSETLRELRRDRDRPAGDPYGDAGGSLAGWRGQPCRVAQPCSPRDVATRTGRCR